MGQGQIFQTIGMMSGTSADGIDVALIQTDGVTIYGIGAQMTVAYPQDIRKKIREASQLALEQRVTFGSLPESIHSLNNQLENAHAAALNTFLQHFQIDPLSIDIIGVHGQTLAHNPAQRYTLQLVRGSPLQPIVSQATIISDFRTENVLNGGQGAPLVPAYHVALAKYLDVELPCLFVNIGGVANVTYVGSKPNLDTGEGIIGFDTGPGNGLMDDVCQQKLNVPFDAHGAIASKGHVDQDVLQQWFSNPYFSAPPPKSLDRNSFTANAVSHLCVEDQLATLSEFTALSIAACLAHFSTPPQALIVSGGGVHNTHMLTRLEALFKIPVLKLHEKGIDPDAIEAQAFAFLGVRKHLGLPFTYHNTTG